MQTARSIRVLDCHGQLVGLALDRDEVMLRVRPEGADGPDMAPMVPIAWIERSDDDCIHLDRPIEAVHAEWYLSEPLEMNG